MTARTTAQRETAARPAGRRMVRLEPATGLAAALFRVLPKTPVRPTLDVRWPLGDGRFLRFSAREALGVPEQSLLLVLLETAAFQFQAEGDACLLQRPERRDPTSTADQLWHGLHGADAAATGRTLRVVTTWDDVHRRLGCGNGGSSIAVRRECLRRLCEVVVWEEDGQRRRTRQSLLLFLVEGDDRRLHLALNQRLATAFLGGQYARVSLTERLSLRQDVTQALHAFLSTAIRPGHQLVVNISTLLLRLWPDHHPAVAPGTARRRAFDIQRGLAAIGRLPLWQVQQLQQVTDAAQAVVYRRPMDSGVRDMT